MKINNLSIQGQAFELLEQKIMDWFEDLNCLDSYLNPSDNPIVGLNTTVIRIIKSNLYLAFGEDVLKEIEEAYENVDIDAIEHELQSGYYYNPKVGD